MRALFLFVSGVAPKPNQRKADSQAGSRILGVFVNSECFFWRNKENSPKPPNSWTAPIFVDSPCFSRKKHSEFTKHPKFANRLANRPSLVWFARATPDYSVIFFRERFFLQSPHPTPPIRDRNAELGLLCWLPQAKTENFQNFKTPIRCSYRRLIQELSGTEKVPQRTFATKISTNFRVNFLVRFVSKPLFYWVVPSNCSENSLVLLLRFFGFGVLFWLLKLRVMLSLSSQRPRNTGCSFFAYSSKLPAYSGAFVLTVDNFSFFTCSWSFFAYSFSFFAYNWSFFACSRNVRIIRASGDCKQRSLTVSKKAPTVSKEAKTPETHIRKIELGPK